MDVEANKIDQSSLDDVFDGRVFVRPRLLERDVLCSCCSVASIDSAVKVMATALMRSLCELRLWILLIWVFHDSGSAASGGGGVNGRLTTWIELSLQAAANTIRSVTMDMDCLDSEAAAKADSEGIAK